MGKFENEALRKAPFEQHNCYKYLDDWTIIWRMEERLLFLFLNHNMNMSRQLNVWTN